MTKNEKIKRINQAIAETEELLEKALIKYRDSMKCLEIEIAENKELGNSDSANEHVREYVKEREDRVNELKNHIEYLEEMKSKLI